MKRQFSASILFFISLFFVFSCSKKSDFTIEGVVKNGEGQMLYLENVGINQVKTIDSIRVSKNQSFRFRGQNLTGSPDFYRIRLKNQFINVAVDSTETIKIQSDTLNFAKDYIVEDSPGNQKIKELTLLQAQANAEYNKVCKQFEEQKISLDDAVSQSEKILDSYKQNAKEYIFSDPSSAFAYFALFQQVDNLLMFNPYDKDDSKVYGALANLWNISYPNALRTRHLVEIFKGALSNIRGQREINPQEVSTIEAFDFTLRSPNDTEYKLSDVAKDRVLLLDFTSYGLPGSPAYTLQLSDVYEKYHAKGFEILQVSLDSDLHFWKNAAVSLPWICVNDPQSIHSNLLANFNIQSIPTGYLFDRNGDIVARIEDYTQLEKELRLLIK